MIITIWKNDDVCSLDDVLLANKIFKYNSLQEIIDKLDKAKISMEDNIY
jgi:hypothetical protein